VVPPGAAPSRPAGALARGRWVARAAGKHRAPSRAAGALARGRWVARAVGGGERITASRMAFYADPTRLADTTRDYDQVRAEIDSVTEEWMWAQEELESRERELGT
jgi:hypothetical protein